MLDQRQFPEWSRKLNFTTQAESLIQQIRSSAPSRRVQGRRGNVSGRYPSRKMGVTIQFESHRNELAAIYELEHDPAVIEMYDQPPAIKLNWETAAGKQVGIWHTPDYFVIRTDSAGYEECKEEKELLQLAENTPQRYQRDERGLWRCPPGEGYAGGFGLYYRLRSSREINWVWQRNIQFLEDYLRADRRPASLLDQEAVRSLVKDEWGISLANLMSQLDKVIDRDEIYSMIARDEVYADLAATPLINPEEVRVFTSREASLATAHLTDRLSRVKGSPISPVMHAVDEAIIWDGTSWILNLSNTPGA
jgi:putative transposase